MILLSVTSPALAHGQILLYFAGGAAFAQAIEGILVAIAIRHRRQSKLWIMGCFVLGVIAAWWFTLGSKGLMILIDTLESGFNIPDSFATPLYWIVMLSTGPLFAGAAVLCSNLLFRRHGSM